MFILVVVLSWPQDSGCGNVETRVEVASVAGSSLTSCHSTDKAFLPMFTNRKQQSVVECTQVGLILVVRTLNIIHSKQS